MKMLNTIKANTVIKKQKHRSEDQKTTTKTLPWVNANKDQVTKKNCHHLTKNKCEQQQHYPIRAS